MAQLYFYYAAMNAGKSTSLLQSAYNYQERGMNPQILTAAIDDRYGVGKVSSRIGIQADALIFNGNDDIIEIVKTLNSERAVDCLLVDESQFLSKTQVLQLVHIVDHMNIPVLCYGLRTDFLGELFSGSQYLLAWADKLIELKSICHCGRKASMVVRLNEQGDAVKGGEQIAIGGNDVYESLCRKHYRQLMDA
ncbi:thymidine kinase [Paraferrimonas sp. SM1919]|uniref:thymidine kinase n=1 Tax=Paraferrimonas sp. SM1919 TaxID=2662263 RepID=UPI0013D58BAC|nr:thymidine kinase [Paraferrimonas sp. SM1919]